MSRVNLFEVELMQLITVGLVLLAVERAHLAALRRGACALRRLANRRPLCTALAGIAGFAASAALTGALGIPLPRIHDEFSYLLAADTFAHGRLTNPPHQHWPHFEAVHVNYAPTYHSMYPPAQGLLLAAGQLLTGQPIVGVWLSMGLACAAICWMLQGWVTARWALVGSVLAVSQFVFMAHPNIWPLQIGYWSQSYWGGAVAMCGGALVFGAVRRMVRQTRAADAIILGLGLAILANSRSFEGVVVGMPVAGALLYAIFRHARCGKRPVRTIVLPLATVLLATIVWMGYYNWRTTGHVLETARGLNLRLYGAPPVTLLSSMEPERTYRHEHHRQYYAQWARSTFLAQQTLDGYWEQLKYKAWSIWSYYFSLLLTLPVIALPWVLRDAWSRFALFVCVLLLFALALVPWFQVHYLSPIAPLFIFLEVRALRILRASRVPGRYVFRSLARAIPLALATAMPASAALWETSRPADWSDSRRKIVEQLTALGGKHVVFVSGNRSTFTEWVYNGADLEGAAVLWAHDMGPTMNSDLAEHYRDRRLWRLRVDRHPLEVVPEAERQTGSSRTGPAGMSQH